jgi:transposase
VKRKRSRRVDINLGELDGIVEASAERALQEEERKTLRTAIHAMADALTPRPRSTEKTSEVLGEASTAPEEPGKAEREKKPPAPGHGRNGAAAFTGARKVHLPVEGLAAGCLCPDCHRGKVYPPKKDRPRVRVRFVGQPLIQATVYHLEVLRCNLCHKEFQAAEPEGVGPDKYDETVASMIACAEYGYGIPFNRLESIQARLGVPLAASTQWELVRDAAEALKPAHEELRRQAACGRVLHNDDTSMKVLNVERPEGDSRTGVFTTAVVAEVADPLPEPEAAATTVSGPRPPEGEAAPVEGPPPAGDPMGEAQESRACPSRPKAETHRIAVFVTGTQHAGENLGDLLKQRPDGLPAAVQMCDALSRNIPQVSEGVRLLLANCLSHGRRHLIDQVENFPDECRYVLDMLGQVYGHDEEAKRRGLDPEQRLRFHQQHSGPVMKELQEWLERQFAEKRVGPNSGLGKAMRYLLNHWKPLTLFLRQAGAPLDNNVCERALKKAVLHRKNAYYYRSLNGAQVGDLYMTLIHTCELNGADAFDYLTELQRHAPELRANPAAWMPWNYQAQLSRLDSS